MKTTKRVLSIALACVIALALFVPAIATETANPNAPIITRQPNRPARPYVRAGNNLDLSVQAVLPQGVEGALSFEWFELGNDEPIATGASVLIPTSRDMVTITSSINWYIYAVITNTYIDEDGVEQAISVTSNMVVAVVFVSYWHTLENLYRDAWERGALMFFFLLPFITLFITPIALATVTVTYATLFLQRITPN